MLIDVWGLIKSYVPSKDRSVVAEKFVDIAMDHGIEDEELKELIGHDDELDEAIRYNLDIEEDEEDEEEKGASADLEQKLVVGRQSKKIRYLTDVKLYEYSLVSFPMNDAADVVGVKSWADSVGLTENEEFLSLMRKCNIDIFDSPEVETYTKDDLIEEIASIVLEKLDEKNNNRDSQSAISDFKSIINGINHFTNKVRTKEQEWT